MDNAKIVWYNIPVIKRAMPFIIYSGGKTMKMKKLVCALVAVLMVLAVLPVASLAQSAAAAREESRKLAKLLPK